MGTYKDVMFGYMRPFDVYRGPFKYQFFAYHPLTEPDRLLNNTIFPISICYGDRDFMGSEGADVVIRSSAFFSSGESQLSVVPNAGHLLHIHNPAYLTNLIIGFLTGSIRGSF